MTATTVHVEYKVSRRHASSTGDYHAVLNGDLLVGNLIRQRGDALCKRRSKFWRLDPRNDGSPITCPRCLELMARYQIAAPDKERCPRGEGEAL